MEQVNVGQDRVMGGAPVEAPTEEFEFKHTRLSDYEALVELCTKNIASLKTGVVNEEVQRDREVNQEISEAVMNLPELEDYFRKALVPASLGIVTLGSTAVAFFGLGFRFAQIVADRKTVEALQGKRAA